MRGARALWLSWLLLAPIAGAASAQPAVWTVHGPHATLVLFGSIHLLPAGLDWEPPNLTSAIAHADEIWFELPVDAATDSEAQTLAAERGTLPKGDTLFSHLTQDEAARLRKACASLGVPPALLGPMRPWLAEMALSIAQDMRSGAQASQGVERQISDQAPATARRRAFETVAQQVSFLADARDADQVSSLDETLSEIADDPGLFDRLLKAWMAGDQAALSKEVLDPMSRTSPDMYRRLITDRNQRWAATLSERLKGDGVIVVVVGAGHLLGPGGVPALLRARGYAVEGPGQPAQGHTAH